MSKKRHTVGLFVLATLLSIGGAAGTPSSNARTGEAPLMNIGYSAVLASDVGWLDDARFVVGRYDGTVSVFTAGPKGMQIEQVAVVPAQRSVEVVVAVDAQTFVTSNDDTSLTLWRISKGKLEATTVGYAPDLGMTHSGAMVGGRLVMGHASGSVSIWSLSPTIAFERAASVRSGAPVDRPGDTWEADNWIVNAIVALDRDVAITASEDGDLVVLDIGTGRELNRMRYNVNAHFGLNSLSIAGDLLVAGNCPTDGSEPNLYTFRATRASLERLGAVRVYRDTKQTNDNGGDFVAATALVKRDGKLLLIATAEKGTLFAGTINASGAMSMSWNAGLDEGPMGPGGPVAISPDGKHVVVSTLNVRLYRVVDL